MAIDYMKVYTDLRVGKLSFEQFMGILDEAASIGRDQAQEALGRHPACPLDEFEPVGISMDSESGGNRS